MTSRIVFNAWGRGDFAVPAYAIRRDDCDDTDTVARSIARKNNLDVVSITSGGWRVDYEDAEGGGRVEVRTPEYVATLGVPSKNGGWDDPIQVSFRIDANRTVMRRR